MTMGAKGQKGGPEEESFPIEPRYHPVNKAARTIYDLLASVKLALGLLVIILICCIAGVTLVRGERAWSLIFTTLWFNGLLVLLVVNVAFCFFGRIWGRKITLISLGMILFHLSFVAMLGGIVYNSLFYFRGTMRITEGETLSNGDLRSYDHLDHGRFFDYRKLKGETTLVKMHTAYVVSGSDKKLAYEIEVSERGLKDRGIIYITQHFDHNGFKYYDSKEGYSILVMLYDYIGRKLYGGHIPLQSLRGKENTYLYTTGTRSGPGSMPFPQEPLEPFMRLQLAYQPSFIKERSGHVLYTVRPYDRKAGTARDRIIAEGKAEIAERFKVRDNYLAATEVRYWVGMSIRYEPGQPIVLSSLWVGLGGMVITFIGRLRRG